MKSTNYQFLMKKVDEKDEVKLFDLINKRLDNILAETCDKMKTMQALLCIFESKSNNTAYYSIMSISYSIILCIITFASTLVSWENIIDRVVFGSLVLVLAATAVSVMIISNKAEKEEERKKFISNVIKIRIEDLSDNETDYVMQNNENTKTYYVTVKSKPADTKENNTEN